MEQGYGTGRLVPTGKHSPAILVSYHISQQMHGIFERPKTVVHSIAAEASRPIEFGDFDLVVGEVVVRLKHVASDPEWLVLSSDVTALCV